MTTYRGVVDSNNIVIAFGVDFNQKGNYNDIGTWCDFTFTEFPVTNATVPEGKSAFLFKIENSQVVERTQEEIDSELLKISSLAETRKLLEARKLPETNE